MDETTLLIDNNNKKYKKKICNNISDFDVILRACVFGALMYIFMMICIFDFNVIMCFKKPIIDKYNHTGCSKFNISIF